MIAAIAGFFGMIIRFIYEIVNQDYFLSIILFTILTKIILFPLSLGQIKSTEEMKRISPKDKQIREKYKNDKVKQSEELTKLYSEHKINPMGGCLPSLIQLPIVFAMYYIVKQPLTYIVQTPKEDIKTYTQEVLKKLEVTEQECQINELLVAKEKKLIDLEVFKGFNLGDVPSNVFSKDPAKKANPLSLAIPILSIVFSIIQIKQSQKTSSMNEEQMEMQKSMNFMAPFLSGFIAYTFPLALGVYWLFGNIIQIGQQILIMEIVKRDEKKGKLTLDKGGDIK
ncbi:MAG: YidC/Oxa1 family membrane protein insertase [Clostridia bacterium]